MDVACQPSDPVELALLDARERIARRVSFDSSFGIAFDPISLLPVRSVRHSRVSAASFSRLIQIEISDDRHFNMANLRRRTRERTSLLSRETEGALDRSTRYQEIWRPIELRHELRVVFSAGGLLWGGITLARDAGEPDFAPEEVEAATEASATIGEALRSGMATGPVHNSLEAPA